MRLLHYTEEPLDFKPAFTYEQSEPRSFGKPKGLWVSVEGEVEGIGVGVGEVEVALDAKITCAETAHRLYCCYASPCDAAFASRHRSGTV
jgi:hypothetical protein